VPVPESADEPSKNLSALQKQLILAQVQLLELEDVRDELQVQAAERSKLLSELQAMADRSLAEFQNARTAETTAQKALNRSDQEKRAVEAKLEACLRDLATTSQRLAEALARLEEAKTTAMAHAGRIETLDAELRNLKASLSWRSTAPLRSLERALGRKQPSP
jgi:chromosome segregation ATPase